MRASLPRGYAHDTRHARCRQPPIAARQAGHMPHTLAIVSQQQPHVRIAIPRRCAKPVTFAASELQRYVKQMTGVELSIARSSLRGDALQLQSIGQRARALPELTATHEDAYSITVEATAASLVGASPRAVLYSVYDVLEQLGCGFCVPGEDTAPRRRSLSLPHGRQQREPAYTYRAQVEFPCGSVHRSEVLIDWLAKNRLNCYHPCPNAQVLPVDGERAIEGLPRERWTDRRQRAGKAVAQRGLAVHFGGHSMMTWLSHRYFKAHPEWFALIDGKRGGSEAIRPKALCVTNRAMQRQVVRNMRRFLDENANVTVLDFWHPDSDSFCHCEQCLPNLPREPSDEMVGMTYLRSYVACVNAISRDLRRTHPQVRICPLVNFSASTNWPLPADVEVDDRLLVALAHFPPLRDSYRPLAGKPASRGNTRLLSIDLSWKAKATHTFIYEFHNSWYMPFIHPQATLAAQDIPLLHRLGFDGMSSDLFGWTPVNVYVTARLMWNPQQSAASLVADFCRRYYGSAHEAMTHYWMTLEKQIIGLPGYLSSPHLMDKCRELSAEWIDYLRDVLATLTDASERSRVERCLKPWQSLGDKHKARWWAVPAFDEDDSLPD